MVEQRQLDGDGGPRRLRQVLAVQHEQREDVPGAQGAHSRYQVFLLINIPLPSFTWAAAACLVHWENFVAAATR